MFKRSGGWETMLSNDNFQIGDRVELTKKCGRMPKGAKGIVKGIDAFDQVSVRFQGTNVIVNAIPFGSLCVPATEKRFAVHPGMMGGLITKLLKSDAYERVKYDHDIPGVDKETLCVLEKEYDKYPPTGNDQVKFCVIVQRLIIQFIRDHEAFYAGVHILGKIHTREAIQTLRLLTVHPFVIQDEDRQQAIQNAIDGIIK